MDKIIFQPIGIIHTPFTDPAQTPIQSIRSTAAGKVEVYPQFAAGLEGIEGFSHIILFYIWHLAPPLVDLLVKPFLDEKRHGVFATRYPCRPNPLGFSVVRLENRENNCLFIRGVDMLDATPLLDIKPYNPEFDVHPAERTGWYETRTHP
ncbi:MAG: tRNA (N6-threonylcarbamoyladenosine(37)-N6)-methyltransferase TrmO [Chloroflexota bacterium]|jgi:tRNA-Thr(GGU) m(6)t(6)A37 methyltransferase TsaA